MFVEAEHTRSTIGTFTSRDFSAPEISLGESDTDLASFAGPGVYRPQRVFDHCGLLDALTGQSSATLGVSALVRVVDSTIISDIEFEGSAGHDPLLINLAAETGDILITSGSAVIRVDSPHTANICAVGDADLTVIVARGRTAQVEASGTSNVLVIVDPGGRGSLRVTDPEADAEVIGDRSRFPVARTWDWEA